MLAQRLQQEVKNSPAKAAGLAGLLVVAIYFWAPLIMGFFGEETPPVPASATATAPGAVTAAVAVAPLAAAPATADTTSYDWRRHAAEMDDDVLMISASLPAGQRDPFLTSFVAPVETRQTARVEVNALPMSPDDAGLVLTSTWVSSRKKVAEIDGKSYRVGDRVPGGNSDLEVTFRVVDVMPRRVILEREGRQYELKISHPLLDAAIERDDRDNLNN